MFKIFLALLLLVGQSLEQFFAFILFFFCLGRSKFAFALTLSIGLDVMCERSRLGRTMSREFWADARLAHSTEQECIDARKGICMRGASSTIICEPLLLLSVLHEILLSKL